PYSPTAVRAGVNFSENPVGAGPFMLDSIVEGQSVKLIKSPTYWDADNVRLAGIEYVNVSPQAAVNAVRSNTVDFSVLTADTASQVEGTPGWETTLGPTNGIMIQGLWCKSRPPFDNLKVRQALNYAIDREELDLAVNDGGSEPSWGFNSSATPFYDEDLEDFYAHDPDRARRLLAEAGQPNLTFESFFQPGGSGQRAAEVIQAQLREVGVTVNLKPLTNPGDFYPEALGAPINIFPLNRVGIQKVSRVLVPGSIGNICSWNDPALNALVLELQGVDERSDEGIEIWKEISRNGLENAVNLFGVFGVQGTAVNTNRIGNVEIYEGRVGTPTLDTSRIYIRE
ncbi:MAG: ABC transporter substrate-binding protein, partial [Acidimicrobiia bacterium]